MTTLLNLSLFLAFNGVTITLICVDGGYRLRADVLFYLLQNISFQRFPLETEDSIFSETVKQFAQYMDEVSL